MQYETGKHIVLQFPYDFKKLPPFNNHMGLQMSTPQWMADKATKELGKEFDENLKMSDFVMEQISDLMCEDGGKAFAEMEATMLHAVATGDNGQAIVLAAGMTAMLKNRFIENGMDDRCDKIEADGIEDSKQSAAEEHAQQMRDDAMVW